VLSKRERVIALEAALAAPQRVVNLMEALRRNVAADTRHTVTVAPDGFNWQGTTYPSLSAIARAITGTAWSGPRFFALARGNGTPPAHGPHKTWARAGRNCPATGIEQGIAAFANLLTGVTPKQ
jgi:hypothetical protein